MTVVALDTDQAKTIGVVVIVGLIVLGALISFLIRAIVMRIVVIVVALVLAGVVYSQRAVIGSAAKKCEATFFGQDLTPSNPAIKKHCRPVTNR